MNYSKRLLTLAAAILSVLALAAIPASAAWYPVAVTNPAANAVITEAVASTDQASAQFCVYAASSVAATLRVQYRNAANDTTLKEQYVPLGALTTAAPFCVTNFDMLSGERIRVVNNALALGVVSVSLETIIY